MSRRIRIYRSGAALLVAAWLIAGCAERPESLLASAKEHLAKNDRSAAVIQLRNALQKNPDLAEARFLLGKTLLDTGDAAGAEKELRRASELNHPADEVVPVLARALAVRGARKQVIDEFSGVELGSPAGKADLQVTIGEVRLATGDVEGARRAFASALAAQPDYPRALLGEARLRAVDGDLPGALALVDATLAKSPALSDGWRVKGEILLAQKQPEGALAAFRKSLETKPDQLPAHSAIVMLLLEQGRIEDANKQLAAMETVAPKHPQTLYLKALLALREKNYAAARDAIQLYAKSGTSLQGLLLAAQIDYQLRSYAKAAAELDTVLQQSPKHAYARRLLAQTLLRDGRPGKALEALQPLLEDEQRDADTLGLAGEVYMQSGDATTAARYFERAAALDPKNSGKRTAVALAHMAKGDTERGLVELEEAAASDPGIRADLALVATNLRARKFDAALAAVSALEKKQPDKPMPHDLRGTVLLGKHDLAGARKSFERALAIDPNYFPAVMSLARLDIVEKKPEDAKKRMDAVLAREPKNVQALVALAGLRAQAGASPDEVAELLGKAVAANPTELGSRLALIGHYLRNNESKKAIAAAQEALAAFPDRPEVLDATGQAYRAAGDINQAVSTYNKLIQLRPESPLPYMRLAEIRIDAKDNAAAMEHLQKALALKPDFMDARRAMIALDVKTGRTDQALAAAREIQKERPKEALGYLLEGNVYASKKAWNEAANAYRAGLKQVGTTDLAVHLYSALYAGGKGPEADGFAVSWLKDHPTDRAFRHHLAQSALAKKDYPSAVKQYKELLAAEPNDVLALNNLAWVAGQLKDPKALEYAERASKLAPNNPTVLDTHGMLLVESGDTARGLDMLQKAVAAAPNAAAIRLNLARALLKAGQKDGAKKELDTLAKLGDRFPAQAEVAKLRGELPAQAEASKETADAARDVERLQRSVAAAPNAAALRLKLAQALIKAGQTEAARKELETLAKLGDKFTEQAEVARLMQTL